MGLLDEPALQPAEPGRGPVIPSDARPLVVLRNGALQECRLLGWQRDGDRWLCHLSWGVAGKLADGWYVYDPGKVRQP